MSLRNRPRKISVRTARTSSVMLMPVRSPRKLMLLARLQYELPIPRPTQPRRRFAMFIVTRRAPSLLLLVLACILSISGCKTSSTKPSVQQTVSEVRCKQPATPPISPAPTESEWISVAPVARLSERAAEWIVELLGTLTKERALRKVEHQCLDDAEKRGLIQQ